MPSPTAGLDHNNLVVIISRLILDGHPLRRVTARGTSCTALLRDPAKHLSVCRTMNYWVVQYSTAGFRPNWPASVSQVLSAPSALSNLLYQLINCEVIRNRWPAYSPCVLIHSDDIEWISLVESETGRSSVPTAVAGAMVIEDSTSPSIEVLFRALTAPGSEAEIKRAEKDRIGTVFLYVTHLHKLNLYKLVQSSHLAITTALLLLALNPQIPIQKNSSPFVLGSLLHL